jgi:hypothetical protein
VLSSANELGNASPLDCPLNMTYFSASSSSSTLFDRHSINHFKDSVSAASADFLRIVIKGSYARDIGPCMHEIVETLNVLAQSENAVNRKSAILCFVEMRVLIGKQFDPEISKLPFVSRKMIQFYFEQTNLKA